MRCVHFLLLFLGLTVALVSSVEQDFDDSEAEVEVEENDLNDDEEIDIEDEIQTYESPTPEPGKYHLADHFDDISQFEKRWIKSQAKKDDIAEEIAKYDGEWNVENPQKQIWKNDLGLVLKSKAKHAAISSRLVKPFVFEDKPLIVQYEVTMQDGQECGGSYMKLLSLGKDTQDLTKFNDKTPYTIMFGPDKCGNDVKLHFIFRHVNPVNGTITEKHCRKPKDRLEEPFKDKLPHLYQLVINPDNTFQIRVDHNVLNEGSLLTEFTPPVNPPKEINDPEDKKPENWDEREKIPDPDSTKPDDWDEDEPPQVPDINAAKPNGWLDDEEVMIPDPNAKKPEDWDTDMDGEWEAPLIENPICEKAVGCGLWKAPLVANPEYKGKWRAPLIENPNYQGKWIPRKIPNPDFFEDLRPFKMTTITAVGFELWSMSSEIYFDNILITDNIEFANDWAASTFDLKRKQIDKSSKSLWGRAMRYMGYKPGWWALYFLYIAIPISFYIRYLYKRSQEESLVNKVAKLTNKYPWLWGVLVIIVGIPLSFILYTFCFKKEKATAPSHPKKTDEPTQDDDDDDVDDDEPTNNSKPTEKTQIGEEDAENLKQKTSPKSKKSDLEVNENDDNIENIEDNDEDDDVEDVEEDIIEDISDDNEEEIEKSSTTENTTEGTRKRNKPRKE